MKFLSGLVLYITLFAIEYKKQSKKKSEVNVKNFCLNKFVIIIIFTLFTTALNINSANAFCSAATACKIDDLKAEVAQSEHKYEADKTKENAKNEKTKQVKDNGKEKTWDNILKKQQ